MRGTRAGFTLLELLMVLTVTAIGLTYATLSFGGYFQRVNVERAAQVFAQDLTLARNWAVRSRESVVFRFYESGLWYEVEARTTATELSRRRFGPDGDIRLTTIGLNMPGDSVVFDIRGIANLAGAGGPLATATFSSGAATYTVSFNSMGASKLDRS